MTLFGILVFSGASAFVSILVLVIALMLRSSVYPPDITKLEEMTLDTTKYLTNDDKAWLTSMQTFSRDAGENEDDLLEGE